MKTTTTKTKKTTLDNFQLFYEEIPLEVAQTNKRTADTSGKRLVRRSRARS